MQKEKKQINESKKLGFLGSDVSKGMCNFVLLDKQGKELEANFQLDDNRSGHRTLYELIERFKKENTLDKIVIGVESTGGYENNWYKGLRNKSKELGIEVFRINPKLIYHETKTEGHRSITDGVSARVIASYLRKNYGDKNLSSSRWQQAKEASDVFSNMRSLYKYIQRLVGQSTRTKNALEKLLYVTMPELLSLKGEKYPNWFLELLINYPTKETILSADNQAITSIPYLSQTKANLIYAALQESVGAPADEYMSITIQEQAHDIQQLQKKIARLKKRLLSLAQKEKQIEDDLTIVSSINGIGADTAIGYLMEIEQVERFEKGKNLVAFWGMNPTIKQSGDRTYYVGMSKDGSSTARSIMYQAAINVIRNESYFANIYHQHRNKGKSHYSAVGIVMTKLARVIYGMLKNRKMFDSKVDQNNQEKVAHKNSTTKKSKEQNKVKKQKGERRFQDKQDKAPVSMTQKVQRRQEQNVSN